MRDGDGGKRQKASVSREFMWLNGPYLVGRCGINAADEGKNLFMIIYAIRTE
jgi:hypothetical protein